MPATPLRIATWNVLADAYLNPAWYRDVPPRLLRTSDRLPRVVARALALDADVLVLQEVEAHAFEALAAGLSPAGYRGRRLAKGHGRPDGCATFWRVPAGGEVLEHVFADGTGGARSSGHVALGVVVPFAGHRLGVVGTHLRWDDPAKPPADRVCWRQARDLVARLAAQPSVDAWVVCGDLNVAPGDPVLAVLADAGFRDAFEGHDDWHTCVANGTSGKLDHVLVRGSISASPQRPPDVAGRTSLPDEREPSDHLPLVVAIV